MRAGGLTYGQASNRKTRKVACVFNKVLIELDSSRVQGPRLPGELGCFKAAGWLVLVTYLSSNGWVLWVQHIYIQGTSKLDVSYVNF